jgi:hypothetical protein
MADLGVRMNEVFLDWLKHAQQELNTANVQAALVEEKSIP